MVTVQYSGSNTRVIVEEQSRGKESILYSQSPLTSPTRIRPRYIKFGAVGVLTQNRIEITPFPVQGEDSVFVSYIRSPARPRWSYNVVAGKALLNATGTINFELHSSEESELIYRILALAGIAIQKPQLTQIAVGLEGAKQQQEK